MDKVIFRKYKNGDIIALFPEIAASVNGYLCDSYEHIGQHGAADPTFVISKTKPAKLKEYADLKKELEQIGYNPISIKRQKRKFFEIRQKQFSSL